MELFTLKADHKTRFYQNFKQNPQHQWIFANPKVLQCFEILFDEFGEEHFKFFTKHQVHFIYSHAELSFAVGNLKNESVVVVFPDLYKMMNTTLITEASATLAHELGHVFHQHHKRKLSSIDAQLEADQFAVTLGFKDDLKSTLMRFSHLKEIQLRLKKLN